MPGSNFNNLRDKLYIKPGTQYTGPLPPTAEEKKKAMELVAEYRVEGFLPKKIAKKTGYTEAYIKILTKKAVAENIIIQGPGNNNYSYPITDYNPDDHKLRW